MNTLDQLTLVEFKDKVKELIDGFIERREEGLVEIQDLNDLKSYVFEEVVKVFYNPETVNWFIYLEENEDL